jgi:capsular polysaccharide biosynthesis protein
LAEQSEIINALVFFSVGLLTGVSLSFVLLYMTRMAESSRAIEVETDESGAIRQVVP